tara:strand:- start:99 stop:374 length:276 start_codon:yes stop_codon:yes gene_type:complete
MHVDLKITTSEEYFSQTNREIDWDGDNKNKVSTDQAEELQKILAAECSIYLLRRVTGLCGSLIDNMVTVRRELINKYEQTHEKYIEYRDFY